jgi:hypothetical protein
MAPQSPISSPRALKKGSRKGADYDLVEALGPLFDDIGELSAEQALLAADKGAPPYALAGCPVSCGRPRPLLGAPCVGAGVGDDELNLMLSMPSRPEWDGTVGAVERRVRRQAAGGYTGGNATSEAMAAAAVTMARQVGEGRSTCLWLPAPLSHLRHCGNPPDQLDEIGRGLREVGSPV